MLLQLKIAKHQLQQSDRKPKDDKDDGIFRKPSSSLNPKKEEHICFFQTNQDELRRIKTQPQLNQTPKQKNTPKQADPRSTKNNCSSSNRQKLFPRNNLF